MKRYCSTLLLLFLSLIARSQTWYFEFTLDVTTPWQDTSFIAATADTATIDTVLTDLAKPYSNRRFINGNIADGNGGCNHNGSHWFLWHFIPGQWTLTDFAAEFCDGRPFSDVDADTAYWVGHLGQFCPWHSKPAREVADPLGIHEPWFASAFKLYPNPAQDQLTVWCGGFTGVALTIHNTMGQELLSAITSRQRETLGIATLLPGLYFLQIRYDGKTAVKRFVIER